MKTPDEIKKGLELCIAGVYDCCHCSYHEVGNGDCVTDVKCDALAYIQQLEADNAQLNRCIENMTDKLNATNDALPRWISVEERLPETCAETRSFYHSVAVLASENGRIMMGYFTTSKDDGSFDFAGVDSHKKFYDFAKPSHWMPLPEPPKEERNTDDT